MSQTITIAVSGMKCGGCEATLSKALQALPGVLTVAASHSQQQVEISYQPAIIDPDTLENAILAAGFQVF